MTNIIPAGKGPTDAFGRHRRPTFTLNEAVKSGICDRETYLRVAPFWKAAVTHHDTAGTPAHLCEPPTTLTNKLAGIYQDEAEDEAEQVARAQADPRLTYMETGLEQITTLTDDLARRAPNLNTRESKQTFTPAKAVDRVTENQESIDNDINAGLRHHERVSPAWRAAGNAAPYGEAGGLLAVMTLTTNVDWADPFADLIGFSFAAIIVIAIVLVQAWSSRTTGRALNHLRQARAENDAAGQEEATRGLRHGLTGLIPATAAITGGIVYRAWALGVANSAGLELPLLVGLALFAGIGMPILSVFTKAFDGSTLSRENDELTAQLDTDHAVDEALRTTIAGISTSIDARDHEITEEVFPHIIGGVRDRLARSLSAYAWLRVQIGGLPNHTENTAKLPELTDGNLIQAPIPGAAPVELRALGSRNTRRTQIQCRHRTAMKQFNAIPQHPWHRK